MTSSFNSQLGLLGLVECLLHLAEFFSNSKDRLVTNLHGAIQVALDAFPDPMRLLELAVDNARQAVIGALLVLPTRL